MCGRYVAASSPDDIAGYFDAEVPEAHLAPSWNVAPTDDVYAVRSDGRDRRLDVFHWGLVPAWADDPRIGSRMINARSETLADKGAFKGAYRRRRCLVPADGFYEWARLGEAKAKQPHYIRRADGEPFAFAGLWAGWRGPTEGDRLRSATIVTTAANEAIAPLHDRMPVVLPAAAWDEWLDPDNDDVDALGRLLVPAPSSLIATHLVSTLVNYVRNQGPELVAPAEPETLFG